MKYNVKNGLKKCYVSVISTDGSYGVPKELGDLIEISITASENSTSLYAGNGVIMVDSALGEIDTTISIPALSEENEALLFGHKVATGGGIIKSSNDVKPYVALLVEQTSKNSESGAGVDEYLTLYKGQFNLSEKKGKTKEGGVEFQTTSLSAKFMPVESGVWMHIVASDSPDFDATEHATKWAKVVELPTVKVVTP